MKHKFFNAFRAIILFIFADMDVELLSKMVLELAEERDVIGLPGLGSFKAEMVPASFSDRGYTINPPFRRLTFSQGETSDTSLVDFYSSQNEIRKEEALTILESFFRDLTKQVVSTRDVALPGLGRFRAMAGGRMFFVCDPELNVYPDGFGLEPVSLRNTQPDLASAQSPAPAPAEATAPAETPARIYDFPRHRTVVTVLVILGVILLAAVSLRLMGTFFPETIDRILYTPEELQIIYR